VAILATYPKVSIILSNDLTKRIDFTQNELKHLFNSIYFGIMPS